MFKIGQRVKHEELGEGYIRHPEHNGYNVKFSTGAYYISSPHLSPLYKPGDTVRIKSKEEILSIDPRCGFYTRWSGEIFTLKGRKGHDWLHGGQHGCLFVLDESILEWHSEGKPEDEYVTVDVEFPPGSVYVMPPLETLVAEVHQDKERNRAVLAQELDYKPYFRIQYRCMSGCGYEGSQTEVKDHMKQKHNETTPNLTSPVWDKFKVK